MHLSYSTADAHNAIPDKALIRSYWKHYKNGMVYTIIGFSWFGDTDEWLILHKREGCEATFVRTFGNFFSEVVDSEGFVRPRYVMV